MFTDEMVLPNGAVGGQMGLEEAGVATGDGG